MRASNFKQFYKQNDDNANAGWKLSASMKKVLMECAFEHRCVPTFLSSMPYLEQYLQVTAQESKHEVSYYLIGTAKQAL